METRKHLINIQTGLSYLMLPLLGGTQVRIISFLPYLLYYKRFCNRIFPNFFISFQQISDIFTFGQSVSLILMKPVENQQSHCEINISVFPYPEHNRQISYLANTVETFPYVTNPGNLKRDLYYNKFITSSTSMFKQATFREIRLPCRAYLKEICGPLWKQ